MSRTIVVLLALLVAAPAVAQTAAEPAGAPSQCPDNMAAYAGSAETVTCTCLAELVDLGSVWGTDVYTADSATCRAARHAGLVGRQGGTVTVLMLDGQARYPGTTRNGVASSNFGAYGASFRFEAEAAAEMSAAPAQPAPAQPARPSQCPDNMAAFAGSDELVACTCTGEGTVQGSVWGTDVYTADSATCRAALHAGMIAPSGGPVSVRMLPGEARYPGTTRRGVASSNYGAYPASYRFEGGPATTLTTAPVQAPVLASLQRAGEVQLYVTFRTGSADLDVAAAPVLAQVRDALGAEPRLRLRLIGHTDTTGSAATNLLLSHRRAASVRDWLVANGVAADRLAAEGRGSSEPIADNASEAGRSLNRRVQAVRME